MAKKFRLPKETEYVPVGPSSPIWELGITELEGRSLEKSTRDDVNEMLKHGWILLHVYTLKYREEDIWRERPMAILGKPRPSVKI